VTHQTRPWEWPARIRTFGNTGTALSIIDLFVVLIAQRIRMTAELTFTVAIERNWPDHETRSVLNRAGMAADTPN
jgi:hypothetical protein